MSLAAVPSPEVREAADSPKGPRPEVLTEGTRPVRDAPLVAALSGLAVRVQRGRTMDAVLETAGQGALDLGMRLVAFQVEGRDLILRYLATVPYRLAALERQIGRPLRGLRAPASDWPLVEHVVLRRQTVYREDLLLFDGLLRCATGYDATPLDAVPETAGITNGVLAPLYVREQPWGLLAVVSRSLTRHDADAVALFATHVASALEIAELVKRERLAALGELAAVVAHEVRNPLAVVFNSVASLRKILRSTGPAGSDGLDAEALLTMMAEEADRLNHIVTDLLDFARPHEPELAPGPLGTVVEEAVAAAAASSDAVRVHVAPGIPPVEMDARLLRQALLNIVLNGLQAMPKGGTLTVSARTERREGRAYARVDVADTGPGIPVELRERIFQPFFTTKAKGTGLGLAVVKRIAEAHRGEVAVESGADGTTFTLWLPAQERWAPS